MLTSGGGQAPLTSFYSPDIQNVKKILTPLFNSFPNTYSLVIVTIRKGAPHSSIVFPALSRLFIVKNDGKYMELFPTLVRKQGRQNITLTHIDPNFSRQRFQGNISGQDFTSLVTEMMEEHLTTPTRSAKITVYSPNRYDHPLTKQTSSKILQLVFPPVQMV